MHPPQLPGCTHRFVDTPDLRIHVAEIGEGPPVVLLHGWPEDHRAWTDVYPLLAPHYRVIMPDLRGLGWTEAREPYDKIRLARDLLALMDAMELPRVALVGHDWGGYAGFLACLEAPERFSAFVACSIVGPWPAKSLEALLALRNFWYQPVIASPIGARLVAGKHFLRLVLKRASLGRLSPERIEAYVARYAEPGPSSASVGIYRSFLTRELRQVRAGRYAGHRLQMPVRILIGDRDPAITRAMLGDVETRGDDVAVEWVPDVGHCLPEERPELVAQRAMELFRSG